MTKKQLRKIIKEEITKIQLNESAIIKRIDSMIEDIIKAIQSEDSKIIDKKTLDKHTDGEILGQVLIPILSSRIMKLKDKKGFQKQLKKII